MTQENNLTLKNKYQISDEYDYIRNSIYKTFLACDVVSDEVLLSYHYRCHPKIIQFNNKKYYNSRLNIQSTIQSGRPLVFTKINESEPEIRNTSPLEAEYILDFVLQNKENKIGVALTGKTSPSTYSWLKGNKELINVATSRAKEQMILLANSGQIDRLHAGADDDDLYELVEYVKTNGESIVTQKTTSSRALGVKTYSTETESTFYMAV